jgi:2-dehydro-3-deoxyphosphogluconate aldolase/(4S)-4-hydroxy-2-oxoglutarate aldolase
VSQDLVPSHNTLAHLLRACGVLPVLRSASAAQAGTHVEALAAAGLPVIELTTSTPDWPAALAAVGRDHPDLHIGLGTVRNPDDARRACDAGARFLVTPWPAPAVRLTAAELGLPLIEGGFTPGEVAGAAHRGIAKVFPAHLGGPDYLRSLLPVLPGALLVPTGGIELDDVPQWLAAGALAVGVGSGLLRALEADPAGTADRLARIAPRTPA